MKLKKLLGVLLAGACVVSGFAGQEVKVSADVSVNLRLTETVGDGVVDLKLEIVGDAAEVGSTNYTINYDTEVFTLSGKAQKGSAEADICTVNGNTAGMIKGNAAFNEGCAGDATDIMVATLQLNNGTFSKDDITFASYMLTDVESNKLGDQTTLTPEIVVICGHANTHDETVTPANCQHVGSANVVCNVCGEVVETKELKKLEHSWNDGKVTKQPKCTEKGERTFTCSVCNETKTEDIDPLNHKWDDGKVTKQPKCTEKGVRTFTCTVCNETRTEDIDPVDHQWDEGKVEENPDCENAGVMKFTCKVGGETKTEPIPALGHDFTSYEVVKVETEEEEGEIKRTCSRCNKVITETIPKLEAKNFEIKDAEGKDTLDKCTVGDKLTLKAEVFSTATGEADQIGDIRYVPKSYKIGDVVTAFEGTDYSINFAPDEAGKYTIAVEYAREVFGATGWVADAKTYTFDKVVDVAEKAAPGDDQKADDQKADDQKAGDDKKADDSKNAADNKNANNGKAADQAKTTPKTGDSAVVMMVLVALLGISGTTVFVARKRREF